MVRGNPCEILPGGDNGIKVYVDAIRLVDHR
jgi:hypothetical protein